MALPTDKLCHNYALADIRLATQNFDDKLVVGRGGFGKVYKGHIKSQESGSTIVAIKRLDSTSDQGAPEFVAEIEMLSRLRHAHLVSLLGCCVDDKEMIIVYEYMPNGTVYHHLHNSNIPLSWMQRLRISIGAARGLDYLHTGAGTKHGVIHRDVKSLNILLDEDWEAKISDFGLAKICPINQSSTYINTGIKGTFGYIDPDTFLTGKFTRKTDVFAFGVVLFELLSGRRAVSPDGDENLSLARWAQKCVRKRNLDQLVADKIRGEVSPKSLKEFSQIANRCLHSDPYERPTMSEVVVALQLSESLQEKFNKFPQRAGLFGFTWKLPSYFASPTRKNPGHTERMSTRNGEISINCSSVSTEDGANHNDVPPGQGGTKALNNSKINIDCGSVPTEDRGDSSNMSPADNERMSPRDSEINIDCSSVSTEDDSVNYDEMLIDNEQILTHDLKMFTSTDLMCATGNFEIGKTKVGQDWAYKGWVDEKIYSPSRQGVGLAITVMQCLHTPEGDLQLWGEFSHPNLHRLLGYCLKDDKFYLVHELMKNGNLEDYLRKEAVAILPFTIRVRIAVDVARGLVFLHHKKLIIKGWMLNTHHILLDKDFNAKLFYFDVARLVNQSSPIEFMSRQCDINGLGMLLLEILTGRPILSRRQMDLVIKEYPSSKVGDIPDTMIKDLVDPRMILSAPQLERARELLSVILKCNGLYYTIDELLNDLEQIYSRTRAVSWFSVALGNNNKVALLHL